MSSPAPRLPKVLVTIKSPPEHLAPLDGLAEVVMPDWGVAACPRSEVLSLIGDCEAVISQGELRVDGELLDAAPRLRMVANAAMGIDNLDLAELARRGIAATNTPDAFALSTADHTMGLLLALTRRIAEGDRYVRTGDWTRDGRQPLRWESRLAGAMTAGLVGYGRIAKLVETRARAFGMTVLHTRATPSDDPNFRPLDDLLKSSDVVIVLVPLSERTRSLIGAPQLASMSPGSFLINVARGPVVDESALIEALASGHLGGAALDVFAEEPEVPSALRQFPNVVLTPHTGGATREERRRGRLEAAAEVARFLSGEPLLNPC
jgi:glyoxylate reductase